MSGPIDTAALGVPPIDSSLLPADVRAGGNRAEQLYSTALAFENLLLQQLSTSMMDTTGSGSASGDPLLADGSADSTGTGTGAGSGYSDLLPGALANSLTSSGGLGLGDQLYSSLSSQASA